jgi:hypothetical protein
VKPNSDGSISRADEENIKKMVPPTIQAHLYRSRPNQAMPGSTGASVGKVEFPEDMLSKMTEVATRRSQVAKVGIMKSLK